jgi:hypothetical protein
MRDNQKEILTIFYLLTFLFHINNHYICEVKYCRSFYSSHNSLTGQTALPLLILKWQALCILND